MRAAVARVSGAEQGVGGGGGGGEHTVEKGEGREREKGDGDKDAHGRRSGGGLLCKSARGW